MHDVLQFPAPATVQQHPDLPPDAEARRTALDTQRSFIVEAPAGSGKTGLLIQRFLKLLADPSVTEPEQVLAITFTNAATADLRDRILRRLESAQLVKPALVVAPDPDDFQAYTDLLARSVLVRSAELGWELLSQPHRLNIRTIDSVCAQIARTLPVLSGSGGRLAPAIDADPLYRSAARRTLLLFGADGAFDTALRDLLLHRDGNLADCEALVAEMLRLRDQWATLFPLNPDVIEDDAYLDLHLLPRLQHALDDAICAGLTPLVDRFPPGVLAELAELASEMATSQGYKGRQSPIAHCLGRIGPPGATTADLAHWQALIHLLVKPSRPRDWRKSLSRHVLGFEIERSHEAPLKHLIQRIADDSALADLLCHVDALPPAIYPPAQWAVAKSLFRVLGRALVELQLVFAQQNQCDFTEISLLARHAIEEATGVDDLDLSLGARLQHLLVDEMQDTSTGQYDLIEQLTASWDGHSQTLFLVGDPRQSIYLFRQAQVARFLRTLDTGRLGGLPLTRLRLTTNFRSQRTLVEQFNRNFAPIFRDDDVLSYRDAAAILPPAPESRHLLWHIHPLVPTNTTASTAELRHAQALDDAGEIARIAADWIGRPLSRGRVEPWKIAVLVSNRSHLTDIVTVLKQQRIPYRAVEIDSLAERQEILDLTALTRALLHPGDRTAALALLRAPWCGLSLADLHLLTGSDPLGRSPDAIAPGGSDLRYQAIQRILLERGHLLSDEAGQRLQRVWTVLSVSAALRARTAPSELVERAWRNLDGPAWLGKDEIANTNRYFNLLNELEVMDEVSGGMLESNLLSRRLKKLYAAPATMPPHQSFVELLTIHKAKGLEWDVVLVPALERQPAGNRTRLLTWAELDPTGDAVPNASQDHTPAPILLAPIAARGEEVDPLTKWLKFIHTGREAAERKRLFYVACTRARRELHLFAAPGSNTAGQPSLRPTSLLKAAWPAAEPHFAAAMEALSHAAALTSPAAAEPMLFDLAAAAEPAALPAAAALRPRIQRLPISCLTQPAPSPAETDAPAREATPPERLSIHRPEGSVAARVLGNTVHDLLQRLADQVAKGLPTAELLTQLPSLEPRITALVRASGLSSTIVGQIKRDTQHALGTMLRDPVGLWLLEPHDVAGTELSLTSAAEPDEPRRQDGQRRVPASIRTDRIFIAGDKPGSHGNTHLWIVDYKTTSHAAAGLDEFLASQRATYTAQLENYARVLAPVYGLAPEHVRLALYYPTLPHLLWWTMSEESKI